MIRRKTELAVPVFNTLIWGESLNSRLWNLASGN